MWASEHQHFGPGYSRLNKRDWIVMGPADGAYFAAAAMCWPGSNGVRFIQIAAGWGARK